MDVTIVFAVLVAVAVTVATLTVQEAVATEIVDADWLR